MATRSRPPLEPAPLLIRETGHPPSLGASIPSQPYQADPLRTTEVSQEVRTNVKNISQAVNVVKDGLAQLQSARGPHTPEEQKPPRSRKLPGPRPKPSLLARLNHSSGLQPPSSPQGPPGATPFPFSIPTPPRPSLQDRLQQPKDLRQRLQNWLGGQTVADSNVGLGASQPEAVPLGLGGPLLPPHEHGRSGRAWAHPHLDQLGSHRALIQTMDEFKNEFLAAFGNPDATRAAERKITSLTQTGTCAKYITKFRTLQMELDWNDAALRGQFARGLHWRSENKLPQGRDNPATKTGPLSSDPNYVSEEERNRRRAEGLCVKCGKPGHKFAECRTGWKATPKEDKGKAKEAAKIGEDSEYQSGKDGTTPPPPNRSPHSLYRYHARWVEPPGRQNLEKANLTFSFDGKPIAQEEEADKNPLEGVPPKYHQYAKVFGEEEFNKLRPHRHYDIGIELTEEGPLNFRLDYRRLNNWTKKNVYPLPRPDDLMAQLRGAKVFTKLDLSIGLYESLVMTFGLTNAPAAFQHFMNELFKDLLDVCVIIYLDDILIYSKDDASHTKHVHEVLRRLMDNQLFCKALKCTFHVTSVEYLGIIVLDKGFSLDKLKIQAVQEWPVPTKVKEVQLFLGFANFLRRFVASFSHMARPLHNLVKKDTPWKWDTKEQEAFQALKDAITNAPVLCHADPTKPYFLETDASGAALGSILSQRQEDGRLHPLGFLSESFKGAELNYNTHDKELLAIIRSFEYWRIFLEGTVHPITVFTDHRNLEYWRESRTFNRRHARWHLLLAGYNFQIVYRPGKQSGKPDALSRQSDHADIPPADQTMLPDPIFANVALVTPKKELQRQIEASLDQDESLEEILQFLQNESKAPPSIKRAFKDYEMEAGLLFYQGRIVVPDVGTIRTDLLQIFHNSPLAGHPGRQRTLELVSRNYYWPGIRADTYWHVDSCETCQRIRKPRYASIPPQPLELPSRPWQHISYDMIVDLPKDGAYDSILVIVDSFTNWRTSFAHVWKKYGMPEKTISDRGRIFNNKFLKALYKRLGIDPHFSSAYHPQSDGQTERVNPTVEHFLRAYLGINQKDWVKWLPMAEFAYNNAVHSSTGKSPFKALHGWEPSLTPSNVPTNVPKADDVASQMEAQWRK
ncbi:hypothetical protein RHS01_08605 [Rhizoctonia solani]|uniref:Retrotransposable element Tf2 155 kDa protein type 1 n=1 Tax=Rhizoctonia solani TaxID=456999 RepID=A0A8H7I7S2_9AGAM|nr:hypothetical protein RHS01_08605 [Rhizoctonia solani]